MAQFRLSAQIISRGAGRCVVAAAAYRAGDRLEDRYYGETADYTRRRGILHSEIVLPDNAPDWAADRAALWNRVEENEKRHNAQLAREVLLNLPHELDAAQRTELAREFARHVADEYGLAVDMSIHAPSEKGDDRNHHAHLLLTTRGFDDARESGWAKTKDRRFDGIAMQRAGEPTVVDAMREVWEGMQNRALARADIRDERGELVQVDHRSNEEQGLDREPTIHLGPAATGMQRRGEDSDRAAINDEIERRNAQVERIIAQIEAQMEGRIERVEKAERVIAHVEEQNAARDHEHWVDPTHRPHWVDPQQGQRAERPEPTPAERAAAEEPDLIPDRGNSSRDTDRVLHTFGEILEGTMALRLTVTSGIEAVGDSLINATFSFADMFSGARTSEAAPSAERRQIGHEVEAVRQEMADLFAAMPPGQALLFKRRQRELGELHTGVQGLLSGETITRDQAPPRPPAERKPIEPPELLDTDPRPEDDYTLPRRAPQPGRGLGRSR